MRFKNMYAYLDIFYAKLNELTTVKPHR